MAALFNRPVLTVVNPVISFACRPLRTFRALAKAVFVGAEETRYTKWFVDRFYTWRRWRHLAGKVTT